jgi:hypothetical protein
MDTSYGFSVSLPAALITRRLQERLAWHRAQPEAGPKNWVAERRRHAAETVILRRHYGTPEAEILQHFRDKESQKILALASDPSLIAATLETYTA